MQFEEFANETASQHSQWRRKSSFAVEKVEEEEEEEKLEKVNYLAIEQHASSVTIFPLLSTGDIF